MRSLWPFNLYLAYLCCKSGQIVLLYSFCVQYEQVFVVPFFVKRRTRGAPLLVATAPGRTSLIVNSEKSTNPFGACSYCNFNRSVDWCVWMSLSTCVIFGIRLPKDNPCFNPRLHEYLVYQGCLCMYMRNYATHFLRPVALFSHRKRNPSRCFDTPRAQQYFSESRMCCFLKDSFP